MNTSQPTSSGKEDPIGTIIEDDVEYEVWQFDDWQAASTSLTEAKHYALVYGQDGPVEIWKVTKQRERIA